MKNQKADIQKSCDFAISKIQNLLDDISTELEYLISATPTGPRREIFTEMHILTNEMNSSLARLPKKNT